MGCSKCKQKNTIKQELEREAKLYTKGIIVFLLILLSLSLIGIYSLVSLVL